MNNALKKRWTLGSTFERTNAENTQKSIFRVMTRNFLHCVEKNINWVSVATIPFFEPSMLPTTPFYDDDDQKGIFKGLPVSNYRHHLKGDAGVSITHFTFLIHLLNIL